MQERDFLLQKEKQKYYLKYPNLPKEDIDKIIEKTFGDDNTLSRDFILKLLGEKNSLEKELQHSAQKGTTMKNKVYTLINNYSLSEKEKNILLRELKTLENWEKEAQVHNNWMVQDIITSHKQQLDKLITVLEKHYQHSVQKDSTTEES